MTELLREGRVTFRFDVHAVVRWDAHAAYTNGVMRLQETKAVDFIATLADDRIAFVEVKDFRGHRISNRDRIRTGELAQELAEKVRDSLAGLFWASWREDDPGEISRIAHRITRRDNKKLIVVLWLDDDIADPAIASALQSEIASLLRPAVLAKVIVTSAQLELSTASPLRWLGV